ncbi:gliding motility-associated C-terminal domain-containing protein [Ferruginibacter lapsinanis]|uniref:T9SS type B sorting domain-containing protein n=1 Tax=Ferruginibacter lapsinanis TaxID=563172 RepID=UPI001E3486DA|nr:gliding motility-associated C-terminal domain-containing protein [Ferruginibacter lapsinanis]UEG49895.1 gliding motility-associated C-terminal domain-containing protein [Ferruginibacter lapsinanis]
MKMRLLQKGNNTLTQNLGISRLLKPLSLVLIFAISAIWSTNTQAQTVTYSFAGATQTASPIGYQQTGIGIYYKGTSGGTISDGSASCFGYTPSKPTSSGLFVFLPSIGNISKITVNGTGTGSNRTFTKLETAATINGTYTQDAGATGTGTINGTTCGSIVIVPSANINSGTYIRITFSGNLNVTSIDFLNNASAPVVSTTSATANNCTTATLNGSIDNDGGFSQVTRGFVYSSSNNNPTLADNVVTDPGQGAGSYSASLSSLTSATTYYVKAYGTNTLGTTYGSVISFTTATPSAPILSATTAATNVTSFGALTGGTVSADGCSNVTARGVVWSTSPNPTLPSVNSTVDGSGTGSFNSQITGLSASTQYYVRSYATNTTGTDYGSQITFTTTAPQPSLFASQSGIVFPATAIGSSSTLTYTLTGSTLDGSPITLSVPAGFTISPSTITYTGNSFTQVVSVTFTPTAFTTYSGSVTQTGGGAVGLYNISPTLSAQGKLPTPAVASNAGNDFWLGFGYQKDMKSSKIFMSVYVAAGDAPAHVVVEMPANAANFNGGVPYEIDIAANQVATIPDYLFTNLTYLDSTGIKKKGLHVYSSTGTPISAWMHTYSSDNSAGGSLLFPTNTWNNSYYVLSSGGKVNNGYIGNSYFFVVAQEDNTEVTIIPSNPIIKPTSAFTDTHSASDILYDKDIPFTVTLNKGEVFNGIGYIDGSTDYTKAGLGALDLTGTKVSTTCDKKIAVFGGDGRLGLTDVPGCSPNKPTSDHLVQQMLPKVAWGTKYLTTPTKTMEYNMFKIVVQDPTTVVKVNNNVLPASSLINNLYYSIANDSLNLIESDKPVSVAQYILDNACSYLSVNGNNVMDADPEMITISPVQQGISKVTVYSAGFKSNAGGNSGGTSFINVILKKEGLSSFTIDGLSGSNLVDTGVASNNNAYLNDVADPTVTVANSTVLAAFQPHPLDANYVWARFKVTSDQPHTISSSEVFTAIAYGTRGDKAGESYGYNAGTALQDLTTPLILNNPYGDSLNSLNSSKPLTTCKGTEVTLSATLPFENVQGHSITFSYGNNPNVSPNADDVITNPVLDHSFEYPVGSGNRFYVYKLAQKHIFNANGDYRINVTYFNPTPSEGCGQEGSSKTISYTIKVSDGIIPAYTIDYNTCISNTVTINSQATSGVGFDIVKWNWSYDNGSKPLPGGQDIVQNPTFANPVNNTANNVKMIAINSIGCFGELQKALPVQSKPVIIFNPLPTGLCNTPTAAFELTSYATPENGIFSGNGVELRSGKYWFNPAASSVSTTTPNVITYNFTGGNSCAADPKTQNISVGQSVVLTLAAVNPLCINANAVTLVTNNIAGGVVSGPGVSLVDGVYKFNPTTAGVGLHHITYTKPEDNCSTPAAIDIQVVGLPVVSFSTEFAPLCSNAQSITLNQATPTGGVYSGTGVTSTEGVYKFNPAAANVTSNNVITYTVTNSTGCVNSATNSISVVPVPVVSAGEDLTVIQNESITITGTSNSEATFAWTPTTGLTGSTSSLITQAQISELGDYTYRLTATSGNCQAFDEMVLSVVSPADCLDPMKAFTPNGDGKNEKWIAYRDQGCYTRVQVDVYNRWGGLVYHSDSYTNNWTGEFKGKAVPDATYYYVIKATDSRGHTKTKTGNVTIIR